MNRTELTYPKVGFLRPLIYLGVAIVFLAVNLSFGKAQDEFVSGQHLTGPSLFQLLTGIFVFFAVVWSIMDIGFVIRVRYFLHRISFDDRALYVERKGGEQTILLRDVLSLRLTGMGGKGIRGIAQVYELKYQSDGLTDDLLVAVYGRNKTAFWKFQSILQSENPSAEISNSWTSLDGLFRLFQRRKDQ